MYKKERVSKKNIKEVWRNLIKAEGYQDGASKKLQCFDLCTIYGIGIADSTIDEVHLLPDGRIAFFYNINTGDYDPIESFSYDELKTFYKELIDAMNEEEAFAYMENAGEGKDVW